LQERTITVQPHLRVATAHRPNPQECSGRGTTHGAAHAAGRGPALSSSDQSGGDTPPVAGLYGTQQAKRRQAPGQGATPHRRFAASSPEPAAWPSVGVGEAW